VRTRQTRGELYTWSPFLSDKLTLAVGSLVRLACLLLARLLLLGHTEGTSHIHAPCEPRE
jgi:hypothetical protein